MLADDLAHDVEDLQEADPAVVEGVDADLVRGVEDRRRRPAEAARRTRQFDRRKRLLIQRFEGPTGGGAPVARPGHTGQPFRPAQCEGDRQLHVRRRALGQRRAVHELHHRVHDRLRMHHDVDPVQVDAVEQVGLQQLQALVDQRRGVGGDHPAHVPGGMGQRLGRRHVGELFPGATAERSAAGGEDQPVDLGGRPAAQALRQRRVLRIHRHQLAFRGRPGDQRTTDHQGLLVGQRQDAARLERGQRRRQAGGPGDAVEDDVTGHSGHLGRCVGAGEDPGQPHPAGRPAALARLRVEGELQVLHRRGPTHADDLGAGVQGLPGQQPDLAAPSRQAHHAQSLRSRRDDLQRLRPDRAGTAQDHHVAHPASMAVPAVLAPAQRVRPAGRLAGWRAP